MVSSTPVRFISDNSIRDCRHRRHATNPLHSPSDSGYSSVDERSPTPLSSPRLGWPSSFDSSRPWGGSKSRVGKTEQEIEAYHRSEHYLTAELSSSTPCCPLVAWKPQKLPGVLVTREAKSGGSSRWTHIGPSPRIPDRFVPQRDNSVPTTERYQTTKQSGELSQTERILRHKRGSQNPFLPRRRQLSRAFSEEVPIVNHRHHTRNEGNEVLGVISLNRGDGRQASQGNIWVVGGLAPGSTAIDGHGHLIRSGTNARIFAMSLVTSKPSTQDDLEAYHGRVASALGIDCARRIFDFESYLHPTLTPRTHGISDLSKEAWSGSFEFVNWEECSRTPWPALTRVLPSAPFRVLDAPNLRDDFYCSVLAYSPICQQLAVGLGNILYTWSEETGPRLMHGSAINGIWLTSIAFSSVQGAKCILAIGRTDGSLVLKSMYDAFPRFEIQQPFPISCVSWRPLCMTRPSRNPLNPGVMVPTEDLVVGDDIGTLYYYVVEWPMSWEITRDTWPGTIYLAAKLSFHSQQICGLAWSPNGRLLASGGNDNLCCLFDVDDIFAERQGASQNNYSHANGGSYMRSAVLHADNVFDDYSRNHLFTNQDIDETGTAIGDNDIEVRTAGSLRNGIPRFGPGSKRHRWTHSAAVKAIAFCPWREGLIATGGGSNDKCIHFFHTTSGSALATIAVSAQVTSLIWSSTRREIAATFGYAEPEHPYRIAIFSWPDCKQVAAIPWEGELRALYAISYPWSPSHLQDSRNGRLGQEGCIVVASSDKSVKFHEVWSNERKTMVGGIGMLGGSDILEGLEGIDKEGDVIR